MLKRVFDIVLALLAAVIFLIPALILAIGVKRSSPGPILFWSDRVGRHNRIFKMPKFRSMVMNAPNVATHLLKDQDVITPFGRFIRKSSLDEIPQLWSVIKGDMSLVGPRPALFNQDDLIALRTEKGVDSLAPGVTGWAQVNGRDEISIPDKVVLDAEYLARHSLWFDIKIIFLTVLKVLGQKDISY